METAGAGSDSYEYSYYSDDGAKNAVKAAQLIKPMFVPRGKRATVDAQRELEAQAERAEAEAAERAAMRVDESRALVADTVKAEIQAETLAAKTEVWSDMEFESSEEDTAAAAALWRVRELRRLTRTKDERAAKAAEAAERSRRSRMTDAEIMAEDAGDEVRNPTRPKSGPQGAFYMDSQAAVMKRDYSEDPAAPRRDRYGGKGGGVLALELAADDGGSAAAGIKSRRH